MILTSTALFTFFVTFQLSSLIVMGRYIHKMRRDIEIGKLMRELDDAKLKRLRDTVNGMQSLLANLMHKMDKQNKDNK